MGRNGKNYTEEFKKQIVALRNSEKSAGDICKDNRSETKNELLKFKKENARLEMENDILKQAALIMARR